MDRKLSDVNSSTGWERIRAIYTMKPTSMEMMACKQFFSCSFIAGFAVAAAFRLNDAHERFDRYAVGKLLGNKKNAMRRKMDFTFFMIGKHGLRGGLKMAALLGVAVVGTTHIAAYRERFSPFYFPALITTSSALFAMRYGSLAIAQSITISLIPGLASVLFAAIYTWHYKTGSMNNSYWHLKKSVEDEARREEAELPHNSPDLIDRSRVIKSVPSEEEL